MNPLLEVKDVCLSYHSLSGETAALSHISFHLMPGLKGMRRCLKLCPSWNRLNSF